MLIAARPGQLFDALFHREMENFSTSIRYNVILKFQILWCFRYRFWTQLEEDAHSMIKILSPSMELVLPSPALCLAYLQTIKSPQSLRHLMICLTNIPPQFAHAIFNYVLDLLMNTEQSEIMILITDSVPSTKEAIILGLDL
ncbi:unnamed protein product [Rotaria sordida]|uniref:Protein UNC80 central region domain-containing protein n=1 Tax=Rotaria sordida TaxID=392033 RepID=A0A815P927_9BILA|nr:unnamed protein product [Rotaria sordida]CAF1446028.1 unnamed protein product [Rotaria sordida]